MPPISNGNKKRYFMSDDLYHYMDAHNDEDASEGAWWAILEDSVTSFNRDAKTEHDPFDMVHAYIRRKGQ